MSQPISGAAGGKVAGKQGPHREPPALARQASRGCLVALARPHTDGRWGCTHAHRFQYTGGLTRPHCRTCRPRISRRVASGRRFHTLTAISHARRCSRHNCHKWRHLVQSGIGSYHECHNTLEGCGKWALRACVRALRVSICNTFAKFMRPSAPESGARHTPIRHPLAARSG